MSGLDFQLAEGLRHAIPRMTPQQLTETRQLLSDLSRADHADIDHLSGDDAYADYLRRAGNAFEKDLQPVGSALVATLHAGTEGALRGLRLLLPGLLREVNHAPALAAVIEEAMTHAFFSGFHAETGDAPLHTANAAVTIDESPTVTEAMRNWRSREVFETDLGSAELRGFSQGLRNRSIFSARTTNADYLKEVAATVDDVLAAKIGMSEGRVRLMRKLKELGYDPAVGFPDDMASIPPAERGSLQDLSSRRRLDLLLETNVRMAQGYSQVIGGNTESARYAYPAWQLKRVYLREVPRGSPESKSTGWETRWDEAGSESGWTGAAQDVLVALKDSPIWQALGDGAGGHTDTLLNPFPPFAFRSGMAWQAVPRARVIELGLIADEALPGATAATLTPGQKELEGAGRVDASRAMGEEVQILIVSHLIVLAGTRHATANRLGATPTNFIAQAADAAAGADVVQADGDGVSLRLRHPVVARAFRDITIVPKKAAALTIPINALAYGRRAAEFPDLFRIPHTDVLAIPREGQAPLALFILVRSVTQRQDRSLMPSPDEINEAAATGLKFYVRRTLQQARLS